MATAPRTLHVYGKYMYGVWNVRMGEKMHVMKTPNGGSCEKSYGKCMFSAFPCPVVRHTRRHRNRRRYYAPRTLKCSGPGSAPPSSGGPADPAAPRRHSALPLVQRTRRWHSQLDIPYPSSSNRRRTSRRGTDRGLRTKTELCYGHTDTG